MSFLNNATNETLETDFALEEDFFAGVYNDNVAVASMVIMYIIGLVGVIGILFIIWIERSGQAGPYRTLVNQLVTHNYQAAYSNFIMKEYKVSKVSENTKFVFFSSYPITALVTVLIRSEQYMAPYPRKSAGLEYCPRIGHIMPSCFIQWP